MNENLNLFEPEVSDLKRQLAGRLTELAGSNLFIGTSSWKYEGWLGTLYRPERYSGRGQFSKARFQRDCLTEYAEFFHTVSGDFTFYQFPSTSVWSNLFAQAPPGFRFAFKAPEEITTPAFPRHSRYGSRAGQRNPLFMDPHVFIAQFLTPLKSYARNVAVIVLEFPAALADAFEDEGRLGDAFNHFFDQLPRTFRYAVEIRNRRMLCPNYFRALSNQGIAHVFNSWTDMPSISEQSATADAFTTTFTVSRALTVPGRTYKETVSRFSPYRGVQDPNLEVRSALTALLVRSKKRGEPAFIYVNNRLEGFAPGTIAAIIESFR